MINTTSRFTERQDTILRKENVSPEFREFCEKITNLFDWNVIDWKTLRGLDEDEKEWRLSYSTQLSQFSGVSPVLSLSYEGQEIAFYGVEQSDQRYFAVWWSCIDSIAHNLEYKISGEAEAYGKRYFDNY